MTTINATSKYTTLCTLGFSGAVSRDENPAAHGGVCHIQIRSRHGRLLARKLNVNGRHREAGAAFAPSTEQLEHWASIAQSTR